MLVPRFPLHTARSPFPQLVDLVPPVPRYVQFSPYSLMTLGPSNFSHLQRAPSTFHTSSEVPIFSFISSEVPPSHTDSIHVFLLVLHFNSSIIISLLSCKFLSFGTINLI